MQSEPTSERFDAAVRTNVRERRRRLQLEQEQVAARMRALGFSNWHRQTVGNVEKADGRKISVEELLGLSLVLETSMSSLAAPDSTAHQLVELPNGRTLPAHTISASAGVGMNEGWLRWEGDEPVWPSERLVTQMAGNKDRQRELREELAQQPRLQVLSTEEEAQLKADVQGQLLAAAADAGVITPEQLAEAQERLGLDAGALGAQGSERVRSALPPDVLKAALTSGLDLAGQFDPDEEERDEQPAETEEISTREHASTSTGRNRK